MGHLEAFVEQVVVELPETGVKLMAVGHLLATEAEAVMEGLRPVGQWKWTQIGIA